MGYYLYRKPLKPLIVKPSIKTYLIGWFDQINYVWRIDSLGQRPKIEHLSY
jgi:hypothetical protein